MFLLDVWKNNFRRISIGIGFIMAILICIVVTIYVRTILRTTNDLDEKDLYKLTVIHINDFHARYNEISPSATRCKPNATDCIGGFSRVYAAITHLMQTKPNPILLNAGDNFQGTIYYNVYSWNITQFFMNQLPFDAMTLGNHEFGDGIDGVVPYIKALKAPIVLANVNATLEPTFRNLTKKSVIVNRDGRKIGIIGVLIKTTNVLSFPGNLIFMDEVQSVKYEAERLKKHENCDIIIVLSHCGKIIEREIAQKGGPYIDLIVGGHSHSLYISGNDYPPFDIKEAEYPEVITQESGRQVLIVQSSCYSKYIGEITLYFNKNNEIVKWDGNSIKMSHESPKDPQIDALLDLWHIDSKIFQKVADLSVPLYRTACKFDECEIGDLIADSMASYWKKKMSNETKKLGPIALVGVGTIRTSFQKGEIAYDDIISVLPFYDTVDSYELCGKYIAEALEYGASRRGNDSNYRARQMLQVSGLKYVINITKPDGNKISDIQVQCDNCSEPYVPLKYDEMYLVVSQNYLADGGVGFEMIATNHINRVRGDFDNHVLRNYLKNQTSPIYIEKSQRITVVK